MQSSGEQHHSYKSTYGEAPDNENSKAAEMLHTEDRMTWKVRS